MKGFLAILAWLAVLAGAARAGVIETLPKTHRDGQPVIALTFDACEAYQIAHFDRAIVDYLIAQKLPVTIFVAGRFALHNEAELRRVAALPFVEIANHSWDHPNVMDSFTPPQVISQVMRAEQEIRRVTGLTTKYFRFPAGKYNAAGVSAVEALGYRVVHWRWPSGDPSKAVSADILVKRTLAMTKPGDVLIFHINQRGWHTGEALPRIVEGLRAKGYRFVTLSDGFAP